MEFTDKDHDEAKMKALARLFEHIVMPKDKEKKDEEMDTEDCDSPEGMFAGIMKQKKEESK